MKDYDIIIIGGGISGLYTTYKIKNMYPNKSFLILEKNNNIGGRMDTFNFYNEKINTGAGVGRKKKDKVLIKLLNELNINYKEYVTTVKYSDDIDENTNISKIMKILNFKYDKKKFSNLTFKEYSTSVLGIEQYCKFITKLGFTDFEKEDAYDVLKNYGIDDNEEGWVALKIDWSLLINTISDIIGLKYIRINTEVNSISKLNENFILSTKNEIYSCNKVIIATTIDTVAKLLPTFRIYDQVHGQTFLRVYGKFNTPIPNLNTYTVVTGPLQKIIPINPSNGVYMIAYSDNFMAKSLQKYTVNNLKNRQHFCKLIKKALNLKTDLELTSIKSFYWEIGTHYYEPLKGPYKNRLDFINHAQHPMQNMLVVGEMISVHQGWTLGALESVESVLASKWIS